MGSVQEMLCLSWEAVFLGSGPCHLWRSPNTDCCPSAEVLSHNPAKCMWVGRALYAPHGNRAAPLPRKCSAVPPLHGEGSCPWATHHGSSHYCTDTAIIWIPEPAVQPQVISGQQEAVPGQPAPACSPPSLHQAAGSKREPTSGAIPPG